MKDIEKYISPLIESQFPSFYREEGTNFISFVKAYYEWLEQMSMILVLDDATGFNVGDTITQINSEGTAQGTIYYKNNNTIHVLNSNDNIFRCKLFCNEIVPVTSSTGAETFIGTTSSPSALYHSRKLFEYKDVDDTVEKFIVHFKEKYLTNIQFTTKTNKKLLIKKALDLYRSKGTPRAVELFFRLIYGSDAKVYNPGVDLFKLSDGIWIKPVYLEVSREENNINYVGKQIEGVSSGATAFVDRLIRRRINSSYVDIFYLSNLKKNFTTGEYVVFSSTRSTAGAPTVIGSLTSLEVVQRGTGYDVGDVVSIFSDFGSQGKARVTGVENVTGVVDFDLIDGGFGYSTNSTVYVSEKVLTLSNVSVTNTQLTAAPYVFLETISQEIANVYVQGVLTLTIQSNTGAFTTNEAVYQELSGSNTFVGTVDSSNSTTITVKYPNTGSFSTALSLKGATSGANAIISGLAVPSLITKDSNVVSYYSNGVVAGRGVVDSFYTNSTPYAFKIRLVPTSGKLNDTSNTNYSDFIYVGNTSSPNTFKFTSNTYTNVNATARVIGVNNTYTLYVSSITGTGFSLNETVTQPGIANGVISRISADGSNAFITVANTSAVFNVGTTITGSITNTSANVSAISIQVGVHSINNTFTNTNSQPVTGAATTTGKLTLISQGSGADFEIGSIDNEEQISRNTDLLSGFNTSNVQYTTLALNSTEYGFPKLPSGNVSTVLYDVLTYFSGNVGTIASLTNINPGSQYDTDPIVVVLEPATSGLNKKDVLVDYVKTSTSNFLIGEVVTQQIPISNSITLTVNTASDGFFKDMFVYQSNGTANIATGFISSFNISSNTGTIVLRNVSGTFDLTAGVNQKLRGRANSSLISNANISAVAATAVGLTCKGLVREANNSQLRLEYLTVQTDFDIGSTITGQSTTATGTVNNITVVENSRPVGLNAEINADVITATGSVTGLDVVDSGFMYIEGDTVTFSNANGTTGIAKVILGKEGTGEGYYNSTKGFLSADKYLFDGQYYQEFSYEILSRLPFETYSEIFKDVLHIAGTNLFGSVVLESQNSLIMEPLDVNNQVYSLSVSNYSNTETYSNNEFVFQSNGTSNTFTGYISESPTAILTLTTSANTKYQKGTIIYQPNSVVNTASGYLLDKVANVTANTLTLYLSNTKGTFVNTANVFGTTNTVISYTPYLSLTLTSITNPNVSTGSFTIGESVTQTGGFVGEIIQAVKSEALVKVTSGSFVNTGQLTGATSTAKATPATRTALTPTTSLNVYQVVNTLRLTGANGSFNTGEFVYQHIQANTANTAQFTNTAIGRVVSSNSTQLVVDNELGGFIIGRLVYGATSNAFATISSYWSSNTAVATTLASNTSTANTVDTIGAYVNDRFVYSNNFVGKLTATSTATRTTGSSNVQTAINTIKVSNTTGVPDTTYQLRGNTNLSNCSIIEINLEEV